MMSTMAASSGPHTTRLSATTSAIAQAWCGARRPPRGRAPPATRVRGRARRRRTGCRFATASREARSAGATAQIARRRRSSATSAARIVRRQQTDEELLEVPVDRDEIDRPGHEQQAGPEADAAVEPARAGQQIEHPAAEGAAREHDAVERRGRAPGPERPCEQGVHRTYAVDAARSSRTESAAASSTASSPGQARLRVRPQDPERDGCRCGPRR